MVSLAKEYWPNPMRDGKLGKSDPQFSQNAYRMLEEGFADAVIISKVDLLKGANKWPQPSVMNENIEQGIDDLLESGFFDVVEGRYFFIVRLNQNYKESERHRDFNVEDCSDRTCILEPYFVGEVSFNSGKHEDLSMVTNGEHGFLHFGPYDALEKGRYRLTLYGNVSVAEGGFIDIISNNKDLWLKRPISELSNMPGEVIFRDTFSIKRDVENLEVRVYVSDKDSLSLRGYDLVRLSKN